MKSGIELIARERDEQIHKHGWDISHDADYSKNELIKAALFCINPETFEWPFHWDEKHRRKILDKNKVERLTVAGALIAAAIDREQFIKANPRTTVGIEKLLMSYLQTVSEQRKEGDSYLLECIINDDIERVKNRESPVIKVYPRKSKEQE